MSNPEAEFFQKMHAIPIAFRRIKSEHQSNSPHPKAVGIIILRFLNASSERLPVKIRISQFREFLAPDYIELLIENQKGVQQVLLVPKVASLDPGLRVIERQEYVVNVNHHARRQTRQHIQIKKRYFAANCDHMARIDRNDNVAFQILIDVQTDILNPLREDAFQSRIAAEQQLVRVRVDRYQFRCAPLIEIHSRSMGEDFGRMSGSNVDYSLGPPMAYDTVHRHG